MLADFLKQYRLKYGLTQAELAKRLSISQNAVSQYEKGRRTPPVPRFASMAEKLGCSVCDILAEEKEDCVNGTT